MKKTFGEKLFDIVNAILMIFIMFVTLYPLWYVTMASFSDSNALMGHTGLLIFPVEFTYNAYKLVAGNPNIISGFANTLFVVVVGSVLSLLFTSICAYVLSRPPFPFKKLLSIMIIITMYFSGGIIPRFLLLNNYLGLSDNRMALILPQLINTFNMIILKNGFAAVPSALEESSRIDGAGDWRILFDVVVPLALPSLAVVILYYAVSYWNAWFDASIFLRTREKFPLQLILREILISNSTDSMMDGASGDTASIGESIKHATVVVATIPILLAYPFLQKYFVKGIMIGAVKG